MGLDHRTRARPGTAARCGAAVVVAIVVALVASVTSAPVASAYPGAPWFQPASAYDDNFPDPSVLVVGSTYYAFSTNTGGAYLPSTTSLDQSSWVARPAYTPNPYNDDPFFNDALPEAPSWALQMDLGHPHLETEIQAPGVAQIGNRYVAFLTVRVAPTTAPTRYCIGVAVADHPQGPYTNVGNGPLQCDSDPVGSIDADPYVDPQGTPWLLWKSEGVPGQLATRIWARQLRPDGLGFASGSRAHHLLSTALPWEGDVIENPSMVHHQGRTYLFYSGNEWRSGDYRTGVAVCAGPTGPCHRPDADPVLGNTADWLGPGGADAFVDTEGRLRLAYHAWNAPHTDYPDHQACASDDSCGSQGQRHLRLVTVYHDATGGISVGEGPPPDDGRRFYVSNDFGGGYADEVFTYGRSGDEVFVGDWDGNGTDTLAVRRGNTFYVTNSLRGGVADETFAYGRVGDEVLVGDWDGDGDDTFAVRRGRIFYVTNSLRGGNADTTFAYGRDGDDVYVGDWDGNRTDTFTVRRGNVFHVSNSLRGGNAATTFAYGHAGDHVLVGDWDGRAGDTLGVRRNNVFHLSNRLAGGAPDETFAYGRVPDEVFVGDWDRDGRDTFTVRR